jgi:patatin-like phospholipase/acyl hydrolase
VHTSSHESTSILSRLLQFHACTMPDSDLHILTLDGGSMRGLSALIILEQLMNAVDPDAPPKPRGYFGGTSTGG